ncbi:MAG: hypothetical protein L0Z62_10535 [Gemmataceae bacterium]|nr:hypothetical protein [Gemmataceae bacterium]
MSVSVGPHQRLSLHYESRKDSKGITCYFITLPLVTTAPTGLLGAKGKLYRGDRP